MNIIPYLILPFALLTSACYSVSFQSYTLPEHQKYHSRDLKTPARPYLVQLETEFFRNGQLLPAGSAELAQAVSVALQDSKIAIVRQPSEHTLRISVKHTANISSVPLQDSYRFTCSYLDKTQALLSETYPHTILSNIGRHVPPQGFIYRGTPAAAFQSVVSDIVTNCLGDIQKNGYLVEK